MYKIISRYFKYSDDRGSIEGLINVGNWNEINYIRSQANSIRGNHYHKKYLELFIIIKGKIEVEFQKVNSEKLTGDIEKEIFLEGSVFMVNPMVNHTFHVIEDSEWINVLSKGNSKDLDIWRLTL